MVRVIETAAHVAAVHDGVGVGLVTFGEHTAGGLRLTDTHASLVETDWLTMVQRLSALGFEVSEDEDGMPLAVGSLYGTGQGVFVVASQDADPLASPGAWHGAELECALAIGASLD